MEWKVLLDDMTYSDRFNSEDLANSHIDELIEFEEFEFNESDRGRFKVEEMTHDEIKYYNNLI